MAVWNATKVAGDPLFFVRREGMSVAMARTILGPRAMPRLQRADGSVEYVAGKDFEWVPGTRLIVLTPGCRIPWRDEAELLPPPGTPDSIMGSRDGKRHLLYGEGHFFHDQQVLADYEPAEAWSGPLPAADVTGLARTLARLRARQPVKLVLLGDSISTGANASGTVDAPPRLPAYHDQVVAGLKQRFGGPITLCNLSVGGMSAPWGVEQLSRAIAEAPDLFIIAFGMNDASSRCGPAAFGALIDRMRRAMQAARPQCDVIVVSTMTANPEWCYAAPALYQAYRDVLRGLRQPGVAAADVTTIWSWLVGRKHYLDLSGNGVNHPNDFGHRVYAETILALFG